MGCGALVVVWALAIWQWGDPVTALYTRWEQRQLSSEYREIADTYRPRARNTGEPPPTPREVRRPADRMSSNLSVGAPIGRIVVDKTPAALRDEHGSLDRAFQALTGGEERA